MSILDIKAPFVESSHEQCSLKRPVSPQKKSVHFEDVAHYCEITHINDFSADLIAATWFQDDEYAGIAAENAKHALMIISGKRRKNSEGVTERGLEYKLPDQRDRRRKLKKDALSAVVDQQDRQCKTQINDPDFIAEVYQEFSTRALSAARCMGIQDEEYVKRIAAVNSSVAKKPPRSVDFKPTVSEIRSLHINDFTDEEISNTWYEYEDFREFKVLCRKTAKAMIRREIKESDDATLRGLEYLVPSNAKVKKYYKRLALNAVLDEQDRQDSEGYLDDELIAREYGEITTHRMPTAQQLARADERFASVYTAKDRTCWQKLVEKCAPPLSPRATAYASNDLSRDSLLNHQKKSQRALLLSFGGKQNRKKVVATKVARQA
jgi:hypothetical protein